MDQPSTGDEPAGRAPLTPRQRRARRRHRRRVLGVLLFLAVAAGVLGAAYLAVAGPEDASDEAGSHPSSTGATTTTVAKPVGPYRVTTGVNIRQGPGTGYPTVGTIQTGHKVFASCVAEGEPVDGPIGPVTKWLRLTGFGPVGYLTIAYVDVGDDLNVEGKIPVCTS